MELIERERQVALLRGLLSDGSVGQGSVAVISGPGSSGKTALLDGFAEDAASGGAIVLRASASRGEDTVPLGVLSQLLAVAKLHPRSVEDSEGAAKVIGNERPESQEWETLPDEPWVDPQLRELRRTVMDLAAHNLVTICIDDLHHAHQRSQQCLLSLFRQLGATSVVVVLTGCLCHNHECLQLNAELMSLPRCHHVGLKLLSLNGTTAVLSRHLGRQCGWELATRFHELTGGDPVLIRALVEDLHLWEGSKPAELAPGPSFCHAVMASLFRGEQATRKTAQALAILDDSASTGLLDSTGLLEEMLDLSPEAVALALEALRGRGLLDSCRFRHDAVRSAVRLSLDADLRTRLNGDAARVLNKSGAPATVVSRYIVAADGLDESWTVPTLREAAVQALGNDDVSLALSCLRLAHRECSDHRQRAVIMVALLWAQWRVNPSRAAQLLPGVTTSALKVGLAEPDAAALATLLLWFGQPDQAIKILEVSEQAPAIAAIPSLAAGPGPDLVWGWLACSYPGPADALKPRSRRAVNTDETSAPGETISPMTLLEGIGSLSAWVTNGGAARVLEGSRLDNGTLPSIAMALLSLICTEQHQQARHWCDLLGVESRERHAPMWQALFAAIGASIDIRQGKIRAAEMSARDALTLVAPEGWGVAVGVPLAGLLHSTIALGKFEEAASCLSIRITEAMHESVFELLYLEARGRYYMAVGRPHASLGDFQRCGELLTKWGIDLPVLIPWRTGAAQVLLSFGEVDSARHLMKEQLSLLGPGVSRERGKSLRVLAAASELGRRPELLRKSADLLAKSGDVLELALTVSDLGQVCHSLGDKGQARTLMRRAAWLAQACGAELPGSAKLSAVAARASGRGTWATELAVSDLSSELSQAELRVAVLAAKGHTNRQIAGMLFITISTVEQHLTRVYRKLHAQRRTELAVALQGQVTWSDEFSDVWRR
jgi:DNA-binding CsgD family transcriptional regulator/DNA-binding transcriptional ArsR family regulator